MSAQPEPPVPPRELANYVIGNVEVADWRAAYDGMGRTLREAILALLPDDWSFANRRVLDFGCGSGRVLRHFLDEARDADIMGCDIDRASIEWVGEHLCPPLAGAHVTGDLPPLPFPDETFDLAWSIAVFSHLTDAWAAWLLELRRVIRPGGILIASVMGAGSSESIANEVWDSERVGMNVLGYERPWHAGGPMVLHSEWWIRAHWGRAFDVVRYEPYAMGCHDAVVLRRPPISEPPPDPERLKAAEPGESRELTAALHSIEQLHRQYAELNTAHDAYAEAYQRESRRAQELEQEVAELRRRLERLRGAERARALAGRLRRMAARLRRAATGHGA